MLTPDYVACIVAETVEELPLDLGLRAVLLRLLVKLLELKPLQIDLLEAFHARVVLNSTLKGALRDVGEASERLHLEVATIDKLINVFLVDLFKFMFKGAVVLGHLQSIQSPLLVDFRAFLMASGAFLVNKASLVGSDRLFRVLIGGV